MNNAKKPYYSPMVRLVQTSMVDVLNSSGLGAGFTDAKDPDNFTPTLWQ